MGKRAEIPLVIQKKVVEAINKQEKKIDIASRFQISPSTVTVIYKRYKKNKDVVKAPRSGRPKVTTKKYDKMIVRASSKNPRLSSTDIQRDLKKFQGLTVSQSTVKRRLRYAGFYGRRPSKKPLISVKNRKARLSFTKKYRHWSKQDWQKVLFSDESKFCLFGTDGVRYVRRPVNTRFNPKYQTPTVKHGGGSITVWGCFSHYGVGPLHRIQGIMDRFVYKDILTNHMLPYARQNMPQNWIYQQDNDSKHTSGVVKQWFNQENVEVLEWPSQSPDINPIEHLWEELDRRIKSIKVKNGDEKYDVLNKEWQKIDAATLHKLIDSMPARIKAVIDSKGYATKY